MNEQKNLSIRLTTETDFRWFLNKQVVALFNQEWYDKSNKKSRNGLVVDWRPLPNIETIQAPTQVSNDCYNLKIYFFK